MTAVALKFQLGARTLGSVRRRLARVPLSLADVLAARMPVLPELRSSEDGYLITSLPAARLEALIRAEPELLAHVRQRYVRHHTDLTIGLDAYLAQLSANTRSGLKRKARRIAAASGGALQLARFRTAAELARFHPLARQVSERTYQERLLGGGLPADPQFVARMRAAAAADRVRAWLLTIGERPTAYLYCEENGGALRYDHVGHDPAFGELSPGSVLMLEAMRDLLTEHPFARFDFTEGEGQHKRQFATAGTACVDLLLLRPSLGNRLTIAALAGFDRAAAAAKRAAAAPLLKGLAKRVRRAS